MVSALAKRPEPTHKTTTLAVQAFFDLPIRIDLPGYLGLQDVQRDETASAT
jgi:hypothetical protein